MKKKVISSILAVAFMVLSAVPISAKDVYDVPTNSSFKTYMNYKTITSKNSDQYKLQQQCVTDEHGLRTYNGRYTIALGNGFNVKIGDYVDVELSTGVVLNCIVGDIKRNRDTDSDNIQVPINGDVVEFIVASSLDSEAKSSGNISKIDGFDGSVVSVTTYDESDIDSFEFDRNIESSIVIDKYDITLPDGTCVYTIVTDETVINVDEATYTSVQLGDTFKQAVTYTAFSIEVIA